MQNKLKTEVIDIQDIIFDIDNPRKHPDENLALIESSMRDLGAARSIVIDEHNVLIAGEGATRGAIMAGKQKVLIVDADGDQLVAVRRSNLTQDQKDRLKIIDNRTTELSIWNDENLAKLLENKSEDQIHDVGFTMNDLTHLLTTAELKKINVDDFFQNESDRESKPPMFRVAFDYLEADYNQVIEKLSEMIKTKSKGTTREDILKEWLNL